MTPMLFKKMSDYQTILITIIQILTSAPFDSEGYRIAMGEATQLAKELSQEYKALSNIEEIFQA